MIRFVAGRNSDVSTTLTGAGFDVAETTPLDYAGQVNFNGSKRAKKFVEQVAEPSFEDVDLGLCDRSALGPIVDHAPSFNVVLRGPAPARPLSLFHLLDQNPAGRDRW